MSDHSDNESAFVQATSKMNSTIFQAHNVDTNLKTNLRLLCESFCPYIVPLIVYRKHLLVYILINISFCFIVSKKGSFDSHTV
jgi:hypothetical protein